MVGGDVSLNRRETTNPLEELPGVKKKSMSMWFRDGEIWFEHLDGIYQYSEVVLDKLEQDYEIFKRPSASSIIAINLDETIINEAILSSIIEKLCDEEKQFTRVAFVGFDRKSKHRMQGIMKVKQPGFVWKFIDDFEKSKEWLVPGK